MLGLSTRGDGPSVHNPVCRCLSGLVIRPKQTGSRALPERPSTDNHLFVSSFWSCLQQGVCLFVFVHMGTSQVLALHTAAPFVQGQRMRKMRVTPPSFPRAVLAQAAPQFGLYWEGSWLMKPARQGLLSASVCIQYAHTSGLYKPVGARGR